MMRERSWATCTCWLGGLDRVVARCMLWRMHWDCLDAWYIGAFGIPPIEAFFGFDLDMRYSYEA